MSHREWPVVMQLYWVNMVTTSPTRRRTYVQAAGEHGEAYPEHSINGGNGGRLIWETHFVDYLHKWHPDYQSYHITDRILQAEHSGTPETFARSRWSLPYTLEFEFAIIHGALLP